MSCTNSFKYTLSPHIEGASVLHAQMSDFTYGKHMHEEFTLGVTLAGKQEFSSCGCRYQSLPGQAILLNPEEPHDGNAGSDDLLQYRMVYIHPKTFAPHLKELGICHPQDFRIDQAVTDTPLMRNLLLNMHTLLSSTTCDHTELDSMLFLLSEEMVKHNRMYSEQKSSGTIDPLMMQARNFITDNHRSSLQMEDISNVACMSKYYFIRKFKQSFRMTPHQFLLHCRIVSARKELEAGGNPTDVAYNNGFVDLSHLNRHFKRCFGVTPYAYKKGIITRSYS